MYSGMLQHPQRYAIFLCGLMNFRKDFPSIQMVLLTLQ